MVRGHDELPIFFDAKGRRWRVFILLAVVFVLAASVGLYEIIPLALQPEKLTAYMPATTSVHNQLAQYSPGLAPYGLSAQLSDTNLPVVGGQNDAFARVIHVEKRGPTTVAIPLYANGLVEPLTQAQVNTIGTHQYAIERYGSLPPHEIALTFDDGPDPTWTPKILDILSQNHVQASFFEIGREVVKYPALTARIAQEGHVIGNHTFDHVDFDYIGQMRATQEISQTERIIRVASGHSTSFIRLPYGGNNNQGLRDDLTGMLLAQKLGYTITLFNFDSSDWRFPLGIKPVLPDFSSGASKIIVMHDGGGDRARTLPYLTEVIQSARKHGYTFVNLDQMFPQQPALFHTVRPSLADTYSFWSVSAVLVWPRAIVYRLFFLTLATLVFTMGINVVLAIINTRRPGSKRRPNHYHPLVSVLVPAYNEEAVLTKTVRSLLHSYYDKLEVVIVDDGSKDRTFAIAEQLDQRSRRVRAYRLRHNMGKAAAVNRALRLAKGEIVICVDADTVFPPQTVTRLVRHFADPSVGAVAGSVKVGNVCNFITRWQALDYIIGIYIERNAQALLGSVLIVPGACGAWRRSVVKRLGGFSSSTLAEDFDLTLAIHQAGYKVLQDNAAYSWTEAPLTLRTLAKQRSRWIFGDLQVFWKHRSMLFRKHYGWTGKFVLPNAVLSMTLPLVFIPLLLIIDVEAILLGNWRVLVIFFGITIALQSIIAVIGVILAHERYAYLLATPLTRLVYMPMRSFLLYKSMARALRGSHFRWNKFHRTNTVKVRQTSLSKIATKQSVPIAKR